ncbi:MAG TPA: FAD-dependent oxidoreductase [Acidobacteriaceae bacterium]|nr:FAD-dependent oxidoreductase [Acidobacteriaceae bacterium]
MNQASSAQRTTDVAIAGAGIIGLSLGLELRRRGLSVIVLDRAQAMASASSAAAGMLAVHDPLNPSALLPLALLSHRLYPGFLADIESLSNKKVPLRTRQTLQHIAPGPATAPLASPQEIAALAPGLDPCGHTFTILDETSLDPLDLKAAIPTAFLAAGGTLLEHTELLRTESTPDGVLLQTSHHPIFAGLFVDCRGAWSGLAPGSLPGLPAVPVLPVKGQMANLRCDPHLLRCAVRTPGIYLIPRGDGRVAIGSTLEHVGFDQQPQSATIQRLTEAARQLLPEAQPFNPPQTWAGLRPGTPDGLPILGPAGHPNCWYATGHYRDGILLAPATARIVAQAMLSEPPEVSLAPFSPSRF